MVSTSSSHRKPRISSHSSMNDSFPKLTPSPPSPQSSSIFPAIHGPNSFELAAIATRDDPAEKDGDREVDDLLHSTQRASMESAQSYELYTPDEDRDVLKKLDRKLVAFMALLYCLSFLDRSSE
jgi:hypothetical protein